MGTADGGMPRAGKATWLSSMTNEAIRQAFSQLKPESEYTNLYHAGLARAIGDWLLGINATRLYTLKYRKGWERRVLSVGRVQTPTLALIVERAEEISHFTPEPYWEIKTLIEASFCLHSRTVCHRGSSS